MADYPAFARMEKRRLSTDQQRPEQPQWEGASSTACTHIGREQGPMPASFDIGVLGGSRGGESKLAASSAGGDTPSYANPLQQMPVLAGAVTAWHTQPLAWVHTWVTKDRTDEVLGPACWGKNRADE
jgi:hypothetical protein